MRVDLVEEVAAGVVEVDLVGGDESTLRQGIGLDEGDGLSIGGGIGVERKVDTLDDGIGQAEMAGPGREDLHDRAFGGGHADEVEGRPRGGL
jgi:hypothetical protein